MVKGKEARSEKDLSGMKTGRKETIKGKIKFKSDKIKKKRIFDESEDEEKFTLEDIKDLGGNEEDLKLMQDTKKSVKPLDGEGVIELKNLISSLDFDKLSHDLMFNDNDLEEEIVTEREDKREEKDAENKKKKKRKEKNSNKQISKDLELSKGGKSKSKNNQKLDIQESTIDRNSPILSENEDITSATNLTFVKTVPSRKHCVVKHQGKWYSELRAPLNDCRDDSSVNMKFWLPKIANYTEKISDQEVANFEAKENKKENKGNEAWLRSVLKKGTVSDKLSAYVIRIQNSPVHNLRILENLVSMVSLKNRRICFQAMESLRELFISDLLIPDKKLDIFEKSPFHALQKLSGGNKDTRDKYLIIWMFQHKLKQIYARYIQALEEVGKDSIVNTRARVTSTLQKLLIGNPECEQILLEKLVNRLGDPVRTIASKAMYCLTGVINEFADMKDVVVREVERVLYRTNISGRAQYYGICFLKGLPLHQDSKTDLAGKLIIIYFSFFKNTIKKGEIDSKLMSALLTGVHRAFPYSSLDQETLDAQIETIHKLVHMVSFNISVQALILLFQILDSRDSVTDRYYSVLYKKLIDPNFASSSMQMMFLNLLFNSIRKDESAPRVHSFIKRMLQVCSQLPSNGAAGILFIVSEIMKNRTDLGTSWNASRESKIDTDLSRFDYSDGDDDEHYEDVKDDEDMKHKGTSTANTETTVKDELVGHVFRKREARKDQSIYDPATRNPLYTRAEGEPYWELTALSKHFHPTVSLFAKHVCENHQISYPGDPLIDFTVFKFLDRFVFRNPKKQVIRSTSVYAKRSLYTPQEIKTIEPSSREYLQRDPSTIPEDEKFIYRYFMQKSERRLKQLTDDISITSDDMDAALDVDDMAGVDFAGGVDENGSDENERNGEDDTDEESESEPQLEGEDNDSFKDLSSGDEEDDDNSDEELQEENIEFSNDDEDDYEPLKKKAKKESKQKKHKVKKRNSTDMTSLLADAESFSQMLEANDNEGTIASVSTKDKASAKQLKWEQERDNFMKGRRQWKGGKKNFKPRTKRNFGKKK